MKYHADVISRLRDSITQTWFSPNWSKIVENHSLSWACQYLWYLPPPPPLVLLIPMSVCMIPAIRAGRRWSVSISHILRLSLQSLAWLGVGGILTETKWGLENTIQYLPPLAVEIRSHNSTQSGLIRYSFEHKYLNTLCPQKHSYSTFRTVEVFGTSGLLCCSFIVRSVRGKSCLSDIIT